MSSHVRVRGRSVRADRKGVPSEPVHRRDRVRVRPCSAWHEVGQQQQAECTLPQSATASQKLLRACEAMEAITVGLKEHFQGVATVSAFCWRRRRATLQSCGLRSRHLF